MTNYQRVLDAELAKLAIDVTKDTVMVFPPEE